VLVTLELHSGTTSKQSLISSPPKEVRWNSQLSKISSEPFSDN